MIILLLASACAVVRTPTLAKIVLLAPFEGRYREVGYDALYAARLAFADAAESQVELLAIDDGTQAANRAAALTHDPQVAAVIVLGYNATSPEALQALGSLPTLIVGDWGAIPSGDNVFMLSNPVLRDQLTTSTRIAVTDAAITSAPVVGGDAFALDGFQLLRDLLEGVTVLSSSALPDADFSARYASDQFAPPAGLLATLSYDTAMIAITAAQTDSPLQAITTTRYDGLNGSISFANGYWQNAPIHRYQYVDGVLTADDAVE